WPSSRLPCACSCSGPYLRSSRLNAAFRIAWRAPGWCPVEAVHAGPASRVIAEPRRPVLEVRMLRIGVVIRHHDLRQALRVEDLLVALDHVVPEEQERRQRVDLVRLEASLPAEGHAAVDVVPHHGRV